MAYRSAIRFSVLVVASIVASQETAFVGAQLPASPQSVQPQVSQFQVQPEVPSSNKSITIVDIKPIKHANGTSEPKNRMIILKSADLKSSPDDSDQTKGFFSSLVDVDRSANKSKVGVHIPLIFDMTNDHDEFNGKSKLDLTVLSGLVTVNKDREKGRGPLTVNVFGLPVYTGPGTGGLRNFIDRLASPWTDQRMRSDDSTNRVTGSRQSPDATAKPYSNVKQTGEKSITSITDSLDRVSSFLKDNVAPTNGRPSSINSSLVTKPPQKLIGEDDMKSRLSWAAFEKFAASNGTGNELNLQNI